MPISVNETIVTLRPNCDRPKSEGPTIGVVMAVASVAARPAFSAPCGVSASSSCRRMLYGTPSRYMRVNGTGVAPFMFHAKLPLRMAVTCCSGIGARPKVG